VTFNDAIGFHVNGMELRGIHVENAHTDGDAMVFFDGANIVHMGDVWFNGLHPFADWSSGGNLDGIIAACDKVLEKIDAETKIIPGHGALGNKAELAEYRDLMQTISERIDALLDEGNSVEEVVAAKPITEWDEALVNTWLTPDQFVEIVARGFVNAAEHDYEISPCSSLHAATRIEATDRRRLERLCRYVIRPPVASGRLRFVDAETLVFSLKIHWADGSCQLVLSPQELLEKLAALVPPPRLNLVRYHGVLAPSLWIGGLSFFASDGSRVPV
jgi:hypothetical protein